LLVLPDSRIRTKLRRPRVSLCRWSVQALVARPAAKDLGTDSRRRWPAARAPALLALAHYGTSPSSQEHSARARLPLLALLQRGWRRGRPLYRLQEALSRGAYGEAEAGHRGEPLHPLLAGQQLDRKSVV